MENAKTHFSISELAKEFDVSKRHIRFCEEKGLISPRITTLNRRIYSRYDCVRLRLIFHFVLSGYSQEKIVELIGIPDAGLNETDQIQKGLAYAEGMIQKLNKRQDELSFHQRTSIINEIKLLREYVKEIKAITIGTSDELAEKPLIPDKKSKVIAHKPVEKIKPEVGKRPAWKPVRVMPVFITGLAVVFIIGIVFYFKAGSKKTEAIYLVQKDMTEVETKPVYHDRIPIDNTGGPKNTIPITPKPPASTVLSQQELIEKSGKLVGRKISEGQAESGVSSKNLAPALTSKISPVPDKISPVPVKQKLVSLPEKQPLEVKEEKKTLQKRSIVEKPVGEKVTEGRVAAGKAATKKIAPEKVAPERAATEKAGAEKAATERAAEGKAAAEKAAAEKTTLEQAVTPSIAEAEVEKQELAVNEVKKDVHGTPVVTVPMVPPQTLPAPEKQKTVSQSNLRASEVEVKESTDREESEIKEPSVSAETKPPVTQDRKAERPGVVDESKLSQPEENKKMLAAKETFFHQQDQKDRLESFLRNYCRVYESKDLDKFASLFTSDATENNTPFQAMLPNYRKKMENIESFNYRIELINYSLQRDTGNIRMNGKYFTRFLLHEGTWEENSGNITMELIKSGDSYLIKRLNYVQ